MKPRALYNALTATLELVVLAEVLWYLAHDGASTLHEAIQTAGDHALERIRFDASVADTRAMIRELPETDR